MVDLIRSDAVEEVAVAVEIWIQPEAPKLAGPWLQNLQFVYLRRIHEECDLDWTLFFLQAEPLLKKMIVEVWDHTSCGHEEDEPQGVHRAMSTSLSKEK
ncbi:hypothetical protein C2845_PM16G12800 [Panicum miliaceum]|uniref:Uncharacterized protein n=1 Tax=Panicum miliaceum TaxID=4540 RepID=A0A3L6PSQ0_PANMI|nr:hypothetical protein C2845_PM16G12800 [Panicum miliaceum]